MVEAGMADCRRSGVQDQSCIVGALWMSRQAKISAANQLRRSDKLTISQMPDLQVKLIYGMIDAEQK
jgi:hypothetical protein